MNNIFILDIKTYLEIMEEAIILGKERSKKEGKNLEQEFFEVAKRKNLMNKINYYGKIEMDKDMILGNLREETKLKILDLTKKEENNAL